MAGDREKIDRLDVSMNRLAEQISSMQRMVKGGSVGPNAPSVPVVLAEMCASQMATMMALYDITLAVKQFRETLATEFMEAGNVH